MMEIDFEMRKENTYLINHWHDDLHTILSSDCKTEEKDFKNISIQRDPSISYFSSLELIILTLDPSVSISLHYKSNLNQSGQEMKHDEWVLKNWKDSLK